MHAEGSSAFAAAGGRYIAIYWLHPWLLPLVPGFNDLLATAGSEWSWYWWITAYWWLRDALFATVLALLAIVIWRLPIHACWGRLPERREVVGALKFTAFVFFASITITYLTFYPLSFALPNFVQWWYIDSYFPLVYYDSGTYPLLPNLLLFVSVCVVGPTLEEVAFRGMLLPRWTHKWGLTTGVLASSALFGVVHGDPLGAFLFGVAMSILYLKSQSLALPILCHGFYNFVVWLLEVADIALYGPAYVDTLDDFRASWPWGAGAAVIAALWAIVYLKSPKSAARWRLPVT